MSAQCHKIIKKESRVNEAVQLVVVITYSCVTC